MHNLAPELIWGVIVGGALINFTLRFAPIAIVSRLELPKLVVRWLNYVPISVMGALVAIEVLRPGEVSGPVLTNPAVWAAALTMLAFKVTKSFLGATIAGIVSFVALRALLG